MEWKISSLFLDRASAAVFSTPPHPQLLEASEVIHALGGTLLTIFIIAIPFQELAKVCHHSISDRASRFRWMKWSRWLTVVDKSMSLCKKALPDRTALHACMRERTYEGQQFPEQGFQIGQLVSWKTDF